jgi:hypothetical protein
MAKFISHHRPVPLSLFLSLHCLTGQIGENSSVSIIQSVPLLNFCLADVEHGPHFHSLTATKFPLIAPNKEGDYCIFTWTFFLLLLPSLLPEDTHPGCKLLKVAHLDIEIL